MLHAQLKIELQNTYDIFEDDDEKNIDKALASLLEELRNITESSKTALLLIQRTQARINAVPYRILSFLFFVPDLKRRLERIL